MTDSDGGGDGSATAGGGYRETVTTDGRGSSLRTSGNGAYFSATDGASY